MLNMNEKHMSDDEKTIKITILKKKTSKNSQLNKYF